MRSGFTIIRNGDSLGYPYLESIRSLAPLVDELVVAVGDSQDSTLDSLKKLASALPCPLRLLDSPWDMKNIKGGSELSRQTNIALEACQFDCCFYLQADELLNDHEYGLMKDDLIRFERDTSVDSMAFPWIHFYGNFERFVHSKKWYRREIRVVKKSRGLKSFGDAQGFRIFDDGKWKKSRAALGRAHVLHYGWVRPPRVMAKKTEALDRLWHGDARDGTHLEENMYHVQFGLQKFRGTHPTYMKERMDALKGFDPFQGKNLKKGISYFRMQATDALERFTGWRPGEFKNYSSLKKY